MGINKMIVGEIQEEVETLLTRSFSFSSSSSSSFSSSLMMVNEDGNNEATKMPLLALNHVSFVCKSLIRSVEFYEQVLGFVLIKRPSSFDFQGAWLFNHGIGIHLLEAEADNNIPAGGGKMKGEKRINPKDNHISFQCTNMEIIMQKLKEMKIEYVTAVVKEGGITVDQLFFHDPDGYMIEICNCHNLPLLPLLPEPSTSSSFPFIKKMPISIDHSSTSYGKANVNKQCCAEVEALMLERLAIEMMNICF